jgi:3,4-dihydroxy 2-butanone 4-phosphate synthase/GTP cyclohydrolase II
VPLATNVGEFDVRAFQTSSGFVHLALLRGELGEGRDVLTRIHSECLTGDALGSLRCDCGLQLKEALRSISAEGRGVLVYATGHEGRGIGLLEKLRAYVLQDQGVDTVDANIELGHPIDMRDYGEVAAVLAQCGVHSVRLLTNNPEKVTALARRGIEVAEVVPLPTAAHVRNLDYLRTKRRRLGHMAPEGAPPGLPVGRSVDVSELLGAVRAPSWRPYVVVKYAQTLDGRIATSSGDSRWISGEEERRVSHGLRAACDAVLVGVGTVVADDPQLNVRMVTGNSPLRVVLDSTLRIPDGSSVLDRSAPTMLITTPGSNPERRRDLRNRGIAVRSVSGTEEGVEIPAALRALSRIGVRSVLVEGGAGVITSMMRAGVVDRLIVSVAPRVIGRGTEAVGDLGVASVTDGLSLENSTVHQIGEDVLFAGDLLCPAATEPAASSSSAELAAPGPGSIGAASEGGRAG